MRQGNLESLVRETGLMQKFELRRPPLLKLKDRAIQALFGKWSAETQSAILVGTLQSKLFRFQSRLKKIQISSGDDWLMLKDGAESACTDLRRTLENAVARFNLGGD